MKILIMKKRYSKNKKPDKKSTLFIIKYQVIIREEIL